MFNLQKTKSLWCKRVTIGCNGVSLIYQKISVLSSFYVLHPIQVKFYSIYFISNISIELLEFILAKTAAQKVSDKSTSNLGKSMQIDETRPKMSISVVVCTTYSSLWGFDGGVFLISSDVFFELQCAHNCIYQRNLLDCAHTHNLFILSEVIIEKRCAIERVFYFSLRNEGSPSTWFSRSHL